MLGEKKNTISYKITIETCFHILEKFYGSKSHSFKNTRSVRIDKDIAPVGKFFQQLTTALLFQVDPNWTLPSSHTVNDSSTRYWLYYVISKFRLALRYSIFEMKLRCACFF